MRERMRTNDSNQGLGGSVVATLAEKLPSHSGSNYYIIVDNVFTGPNLLRILKAKSIAALKLSGLIVPRTLIYDQEKK